MRDGQDYTWSLKVALIHLELLRVHVQSSAVDTSQFATLEIIYEHKVYLKKKEFHKSNEFVYMHKNMIQNLQILNIKSRSLP